MTASADFKAPAAEQMLLRGLLRGFLRLFFRSLVRPPMPVAGQRRWLRALTAITLTPRGVSRSADTLAARPCEWHRPPVSSGSVLLYLHGGAFMIGGPDTHRGICASLAKRAALEVCALDYRLAPEHPYPAARDDVVAAYQALLAAGYRAEQIAIGGDSAGGNLSLVGCLRILELGLPVPAALVCFSPVTDFTGEQMHEPPAGDPLLHPSWIEQAAQLYCPADLARNDPGLSPLFADLSQLPPTLIQVGEDELLLNDSRRLAERAKAAGVNVRLERYPGLWHVFQAHVGMLRAADYAIARVAAFLRERGV
ncbi:alpha/beta hydrolase [Pseudomonas sp. LMG 31766]|uniref:Alpha/beta hydrolase n=1 Tax=Pseudomonas chaetocerotis TaxID=2758695 RepID=A0A931CY85_9PSED|nr:alpha/beta hydrolase [Pseudomonas chaetocerotis]MBZ9665901.1 alpha/beta hydrolase [Pseudomonas chaetocerotis]